MKQNKLSVSRMHIPGEVNGNPLQYACPENSVDRGAWRAMVLGVAENGIGLSDQQFYFHFQIIESIVDH